MVTKQFQTMEKEIERQGLKIYQANKLARSFGNFTAQELKIFDYLTTFIKVGDVVTKTYQTSKIELTETLKTSKGGKQWKTISNTLDNFQSRVIKIPIIGNLGLGVARVNILQKSIEYEDGRVEFQFHPEISDFLFNLKNTGKFYTIPISIVAGYKSKSAIILHHIWEATAPLADNKNVVEITGSLDEFKIWFLGEALYQNASAWESWTSRKFRDKILNKAINEFCSKQKNVTVEVETQKKGRQVIGYTVRLTREALKPDKETILIQQIKARAKILYADAPVITFTNEQNVAYELYANGLIENVPAMYEL